MPTKKPKYIGLKPMFLSFRCELDVLSLLFNFVRFSENLVPTRIYLAIGKPSSSVQDLAQLVDRWKNRFEFGVLTLT